MIENCHSRLVKSQSVSGRRHYGGWKGRLSSDSYNLMVSIRLMVRRMCRPPLLLLRRTKRSIMHQSANFQDVCLLLASLKGDIDISHVPMLAFSWPRSKKGS